MPFPATARSPSAVGTNRHIPDRDRATAALRRRALAALCQERLDSLASICVQVPIARRSQIHALRHVILPEAHGLPITTVFSPSPRAWAASDKPNGPAPMISRSASGMLPPAAD